MPPIAAGLLIDLASTLLGKWIGAGFKKSDLPGSQDIVRNLTTLVLNGFLPLDKAGHDPAKREEIVAAAIRRVQTLIQDALKSSPRLAGELGVGNIAVDGVLTKIVSKWLDNSCLGGEAVASNRTQLAAPGDIPEELKRRVDYYISPVGLPRINGSQAAAQKIFDRAFELWQEQIVLHVKAVDEPRLANLIVNTVRIDGGGNIVAEATQSDPKLSGLMLPNQMTMRIDSSDDWSAEKFQAAICHEIGHLLGLGHSTNPADLMFPYIQLENRILTPQAGDIAVLQAIWGPPPEKAPPLPPRGEDE